MIFVKFLSVFDQSLDCYLGKVLEKTLKLIFTIKHEIIAVIQREMCIPVEKVTFGILIFLNKNFN